METYIALLRGINVSGKNMIKMDALKKLFEALNFQKITTYVQSGNIIFSGEKDHVKNLEKLIQLKIKESFELDVPVIVLDKNSLKEIVEHNPFVHDKEKEFLHVTFLADEVSGYDPSVIASKKTGEEKISFARNVVYLYCPHGYGKTKLNNTYLESKLKVAATTRNWKTTLEILNIAARY